MKLEQYFHEQPTTVQDLVEMGEEHAAQFDFLTQGDEPDRCSLSNEIYQQLFPWYNEDDFAGDTLNTYRIAIKKYYGKYYRYLSREKQLEIIAIIKKYTPHEDDQIFEFEETDSKGNTYYQVCNNYQLGNFGILPIRGGINPKRAASPHLDFFDDFLVAVYWFYNEGGDANDELLKAIRSRRDYFGQFDSAEDFGTKNMLTDYFYNQETEDIGTYEDLNYLSTNDDFEAYVKAATKIISERGKYLWLMLAKEDVAGQDVEIENEPSPTDIADTESVFESTAVDIQDKYKLSQELSMKMAKVSFFYEYLKERWNLDNEHQEKVDELNRSYSERIQVENAKEVQKKFSWLRWWHWIVLFLAMEIVTSLVSSHLSANPSTYTQSIAFGKFTSFLFVVFWLVLLARVIYDVKFLKVEGEFNGNKQAKIDNLRSQLAEKIGKLNGVNQSETESFEVNHSSVRVLGNELPSEYRNIDDIVTITNLILDGRADNFKEAYEVFENTKYREHLQQEAERQTQVAERAAWYQHEAQKERARREERQADAAERIAEETERHNQEVESRWKK